MRYLTVLLTDTRHSHLLCIANDLCTYIPYNNGDRMVVPDTMFGKLCHYSSGNSLIRIRQHDATLWFELLIKATI